MPDAVGQSLSHQLSRAHGGGAAPGRVWVERCLQRSLVVVVGDLGVAMFRWCDAYLPFFLGGALFSQASLPV
eukprot:4017465-Pyramimonas_sp.AAC.1